jgi:hypothetical protein
MGLAAVVTALHQREFLTLNLIAAISNSRLQKKRATQTGSRGALCRL